MEIRFTGEQAARVSELSMARAWAGTRAIDCVGPIEASDAQGAIPLGPARDDREDRRFRLGHTPRGGELVVRYKVRPDTSASRYGLHLGPDRLSGVGHAFLLLPRVGAPVAARIVFDLAAMPAGAGAGSSFGAGAEVSATATSEDLAHAVYVAGPVLAEAPRAPEGDGGPGMPAELLVLGTPGFDTRAAFYWSGAAFSRVARFFGDEAAAAEPFRFLLVPVAGMGGDHDGAYLHGSFGLWFDAARSFDAGLKSVVAHELTHRFVGGGVHLEDAEGREVAWFSEGFTMHLARQLLLSSGLSTPRDLLGDLRRIGDDVAQEDTARGCAAERQTETRAEVRQGARYAAVLDRAIGARSRGARGLVDVVRALLDQARREGRSGLPVAALRAVVVRELGDDAGRELDQKVLGGAPIELPGDVFGPCFAKVAREVPSFELGFDRAGIEGSMGIVRGLVPGSAAEKAGLREGALILDAMIPDPAPIPADPRGMPEVVLTVGGRAKGKVVRYRPIGKRTVTSWEARDCAPARP